MKILTSHIDAHFCSSPRSSFFALLFSVLALTVPCIAVSPATQETPGPKVVLDAGTQAEADSAIAVVKKFLGFWDERRYDEACALVDEPVREQFEEHMKKRAIELKSVDDIRLYKVNDNLLARAHASVGPSPDRKELKKQEIGIDMVFRDGKWWIAAR